MEYVPRKILDEYELVDRLYTVNLIYLFIYSLYGVHFEEEDLYSD